MAQKKFDILKIFKGIKRPTTGQYILLGIGIVVAVALFIFLRGFVACWSLTSLPGVQPPTCANLVSGPTTNADGTPVAGGATATPDVSAPVLVAEPWDGASRVTVLLIGLDYSDLRANEGAPRSDTMMLLTIDPLTMTAGVLSVPRDLWVNIPGFGYSKINNAYSFGEGNKLPGGGAVLAEKTVENFLGIQIDYYAQVDFITFENMIDTIGGVCLDVPEAMTVGRTYENSDHLEPGYQCLDGKSTLGYARNRYTDGGDVDRAKRQQQVIEAIMDQVFDPAKFPGLVASAPTLYNELSSGINTNMSLNDAIGLAWLVKGLNKDNIKWGVIDYTMADIGTVNVNGQELSIMRPYPDAIRELVDSIFGTGSMTPMATGDAAQLMQDEQASVILINGAGIEGLASETSDYLTGQGMNVVGIGNTTDYPDEYYSPFPARTIIIVHSGKPYAINYLKALMQFNAANQVIFDYDPNAPADLVVGLGSDWGYSNPMP